MATEVLTDGRIKQFWAEGYLLLEEAMLRRQIAATNADFDAWRDTSRAHREPYGETIDGRARFDLEPGHTDVRPALRRVASPVEISDVCLDVMRTSAAVDVVAQLIGPNIEFNNSKINSKQSGATTRVDFHQDFMFQPHSNDDLIAVLFFLDDVTTHNGPLRVVPGSHLGPLFDHWHDGVYTGAVSAEVVREHSSQATPVVGAAGSACLMHTRLLHGSDPNRSSSPRTLFICEYRSEDSKRLQANHLPSRHEGEIVRGAATDRVRCTSYEMAFPEVPTGASFFAQQAKGRVTK